MNIKKLWELPILSSQLEDELQISINGIDITISFTYYTDKNIQNRVELKFDSVLCHMHTSERFTKAMLDSYDTVVQIDDSDWLNELKKLNERDFKFWKPKHYAIYFDGIGLYQFISSDFVALDKEVK
ncbi:MAG: hypothetical protein ACERKN_21590 [Velocimicrobium sp.]